MVGVFVILVMSVFMQSFEDKRCPTILTLMSMLLGIIGTIFICNPKQIVSSDILRELFLFLPSEKDFVIITIVCPEYFQTAFLLCFIVKSEIVFLFCILQ